LRQGGEEDDKEKRPRRGEKREREMERAGEKEKRENGEIKEE